VTGFFKQFPEECDKVLALKDVPLLYEGLDDVSAAEIAALDNEIQAIKTALIQQAPDLNLD